jgi:cytochrome c oxidase subunit 2
MPVAASAHAGGIDRELAIVHVVMLLLFAGWCAYLAWVLFRFRRGRQPEPAAAQASGRVAMWVTGGVVVFETVMLVGLSLPMWFARQGPPPADSSAVAIRVVAQQYQWNFYYPGADGQFGDTRPDLVDADNPVGLDRKSPHGADDIVTGLMHVPIGRQIVVQLTSKDVIHSFGLPNFRVKQDVIPGMIATVWFTPTLPGQFDIACSQLCGMAHYRMRSLVVVESADDFAKFLAQEASFLK